MWPSDTLQVLSRRLGSNGSPIGFPKVPLRINLFLLILCHNICAFIRVCSCEFQPCSTGADATDGSAAVTPGIPADTPGTPCIPGGTPAIPVGGAADLKLTVGMLPLCPVASW